MKQQVAKITHSNSKLNWWSDCVGQVVSMLDVYEKTGYVKIRVMMPIGEYDDLVEKPIDQYRQMEGWISPEFLEMFK